MLLNKRSKDLTGQKFGSLTAIEPSHKGNRNTLYWKFRCVCGNEHIARGNIVTHQANIKNDSELPSCGCKELEKKTKHGFRKQKDTHPLYRVYRGMMSRCYNKSNPNYKWYGGLGITVCEEWYGNPEIFIQWGLNNNWKPKCHIDKDIKCTELNIIPHIYSPKTCQFISAKENVGFATNRNNYGSHPNIKLSHEEVAEIIHKYMSGKANGVELAKEYNVGTAAIYRLIKIAKQGSE